MKGWVTSIGALQSCTSHDFQSGIVRNHPRVQHFPIKNGESGPGQDPESRMPNRELRAAEYISTPDNPCDISLIGVFTTLHRFGTTTIVTI